MAEISDTTLNNSGSATSADASAAETSNDNSSSAGLSAGSGWGSILNSETAEHDTQSESADVRSNTDTVANGADTGEDETGETAADKSQNADKSEEQVPWHKDERWQQFQKDKALLEQINPLIKPLLEQYGGVEGIQAQIAQREQEEAQAQQQAILQQDQATIEQRLRGQVEAGDLDPDAYQQALQYEVANARLYRIEMGSAVQSAQTQYPDADFELVQALAQDPQSVAVLARHTHARIAGIKAQHEAALKTAGEHAVAEYVAAQTTRKNAPPAEGGGGSGPGAPRTDHKNLPGWGSILGGRGRRA